MKEHSVSYAPAPHDETPSYQAFSAWFSPLFLLALIATSYSTSLALREDDSRILALISYYIPSITSRHEFLAASGKISQISFLATIASGIAVCPVFLLVNLLWYCKLVLLPREHQGVSGRTFLVVGFALTTVSGLLWISFLSVPRDFDPDQVGLTTVLFWPLFPFLGSCVFFITSFVLFSSFVAFLKLILPHGVKNG
jgi:hypothetical protein